MRADNVVQNCTREHPMPNDLQGRLWFHAGSRCISPIRAKHKGETERWLCPNCGYHFTITLGAELKEQNAR